MLVSWRVYNSYINNAVGIPTDAYSVSSINDPILSIYALEKILPFD